MFNAKPVLHSSLLTDTHLGAIKEELELREKLVYFLQRTDLWNYVHTCCKEFHESFGAESPDQRVPLRPLVVPLTIEYEELEKFDPKTLENIVKEPVYLERAFAEVILCVANSVFPFLTPPIQVILEQIYCRLRLKLPLQERYLFVTQPRNVPIGLTVFRCVVQGYSSLQKYILQSVWICPHESGHIKFAGETKRAPKCEDCEDPMLEHQRVRAVSDYYTVRALAADSLKTPVQLGRIHQSISVRLADDLCRHRLRLGYEYAVTGLFNPQNQLFVAWGVEEL